MADKSASFTRLVGLIKLGLTTNINDSRISFVLMEMLVLLSCCFFSVTVNAAVATNFE